MDNDRNHKLALVFNIACFVGYSGFLFAGRCCDALSITNNTLFVVKILCFVQIILAYVQSSLLCIEEKSKGLKKKISRFLSQLSLLLVCTVSFHVVAVLYGAPMFEFASETFHFASLLSIFSFSSSILTYGKSWSHWFLTVFSMGPANDTFARNVMVTCVSTVVGAWLGAFPIPLDWDRPWQVWPISCIYGTLFGHCAGLILSSSLIYLKTRAPYKSSHPRPKHKRV